MGWADYYIEKDKLAQEQAKKAQQNQTWNDAVTTRANRKITNGVDPLLKNVKAPKESIPAKVKRVGGQLPLGILKGASELGKNHGAQVPDIFTGKRKNVGFQISPTEMSGMSEALGSKGTMPEKIVGGFGEFIPSLALGGGLNKAAGLTKTASEAGGFYKGLIGNKTLGKAAESATKQLPDMATTWGLMEAPKAPGDRTSLPLWAAQWAGSDLALRGIGMGIKAGVGKLPSRAKAPLPEVKVTPETPPVKDTVFHVDPYGVARDKPGMPLALGEGKIGSPIIDLNGAPGKITYPPKRDILTAQGKNPFDIKVAKQKYDTILNDEVAALQREGGKGVQQGGLGFNNEGEVVSRFGRVSNNPKWYQGIYKETGKAPTQQQIKELALKNLSEGYDTPVGRAPLNEEFTRLSSELKMKQNLPDEWHALDKSIKEIKADPEYTGYPEMKALISDMEKQQKQIYNQHITRTGNFDEIAMTSDYTPSTTIPKKGEGNINDWNHVTTKTEKPPITAKGTANKIYKTAIDDLNRLDQIDKLSADLAGSDRTYILGLNSKESGGIAKNIVTQGLADSQGNIIGKSLQSITKQIPKKAVGDFDNYLVYRHAPSWLEQGRSVFPESEAITAEVSMARAAAYEQAHPEFKQIADELIQWQRDLGKAWLVDTGIIKPEVWAKFQQMYPDYIPMQRKMADIEVSGGAGKARRGFANQANPVKKAEGSERPIISPIESIIENTERYVKIAKRNEVMQALDFNIRQDVKAYEPFIEIVSEPKLENGLDEVIFSDTLDGMLHTLDEGFANLKSNVKLDKPNIVTGIIDGEKVHYKVNDKDLLDSLIALTPHGSNVVVESFRQVTRLMKVLTTGGNPVFATRNIARDLPMAYISSDTLTNVPIARELQFAWGILDSFSRIVTGGKIDPGGFYKNFKAMGGGSHSSSMASDRNLLAESKAAVLPGYYSGLKGVGRAVKGVGRGVEKFTNAVETLPRLPEYIRTVKKGGDTYASRVEGLHKAQDVTVNFSKHGSVTKELDAFVPYLNAAMQGIDKIGRVYANNPLLATYRSIVAVSVPSIWLWNINKNNPEYEKLSSWTKDNYFCVPVPSGKFLKIAKPREAGVVFGSMVERCLDKWAKDDPNGFKYFSEAWVNSFAPPTRSILAPLTDVVANKTFSGSPIVPGYMERLSPEMQYDENTSLPAKALGKAFNASPKKIDYGIRSYTGVLGQLGIPAASEGRGETAGQRVQTTLEKTFFADPLYSNDTMRSFYDEKDKVDRAVNDFKATKEKGKDYNKAAYTQFNSAAGKISDINKRIRLNNANKSLSYDEKESFNQQLKQRSLEIAQQTLNRLQ